MQLRRVVLLVVGQLLVLGCGSRSVPLGSDGAGAGPLTPTPSQRDGAACKGSWAIDPPVTFACAQHYYATGLETSGGWLFYTARSPDGSTVKLRLMARKAGSSEEQQLTAPGESSRAELLASDAGEVLYMLRGADPAAGELYHRTSSKTLDLGLRSDPGMDGVTSLFTARAERLLSQGAAVWKAGTAIYRHDGSGTQVLAKYSGAQLIGLDHLAGRVAWVDGQELYLYQGGKVTRLTTDSVDDRQPRLTATGVVWLCGEAVCEWDGGSVQQLDQGKCSDLTTDQDQAAWICDQRVTSRARGAAPAVVAGDPGDTIVRDGLRLSQGRLLWLEADSKAVGPGGTGKIMFWDERDGQRLVAEVGLPCLYCDALWPPLQLVFSGDVIAWSYAGGSSTMPGPGTPCAYSRLRQECR